jgi:hypothetical protein
MKMLARLLFCGLAPSFAVSAAAPRDVGQAAQDLFVYTTRQMGHAVQLMAADIAEGFAPDDCGPVKLREFTGREYTFQGFKRGKQSCDLSSPFDLSWWRARRNSRGQVERVGSESIPGAPWSNPHFSTGEIGAFKLHNAAPALKCKVPDLTDIEVELSSSTGDLTITVHANPRGLLASAPVLPAAWRRPFASTCQHTLVKDTEDFFACSLPNTETKLIFKVIDPAVKLKRRCH